MRLSRIKNLLAAPEPAVNYYITTTVPSIAADEDGTPVNTSESVVVAEWKKVGMAAATQSQDMTLRLYSVINGVKTRFGQADWSPSATFSTSMATGKDSILAELLDSSDNVVFSLSIPVIKQGETGQTGPQGNDAVTYDIEPSEAVIHADKDGNILTGAITVQVYRRLGNSSRARLTLGGTQKTDGYYHWVQYKIDSNPWIYCGLVNDIATVPANAVETIQHGIAFRLVRGLSTATATVVLDYPTIPVVWDGQTGGTGKTGPFWYPAGTWNNETAYTRTDTSYPVAEWKGYYYYPKSVGTIAAGGASPDTNSAWQLADQFSFVFTQAFFAAFARLGAAIMSGDFMLSMNGHIGDVEYANGKTLYTSAEDYAPAATSADSAIPAYTRFCGDNLKGGIDSMTVEGTTIQIIATVHMQRNVSMMVRLKISGYGSVGIRMKGSDGRPGNVSVNDNSSSYNRALVFLSTEDADYEIVTYASSNSSILNIWWLEYELSNMFVPNWFVNLRTGKMSAASGNFVVDSDGNVHIKGALMYQKVLTSHFTKVATDTTVYPNVETWEPLDFPYEGSLVNPTMLCSIFCIQGELSYNSNNVYQVPLPPARFFEGMELKIIDTVYNSIAGNYGIDRLKFYVPDEFKDSGVDPIIEISGGSEVCNRFGSIVGSGYFGSTDGRMEYLIVNTSIRRFTLTAVLNPLVARYPGIPDVQRAKSIAWIVTDFAE